jgi:hypothetical protein
MNHNPTTTIAMVAGDLAFAVTGDPRYSAVAHEYVVGAARKAARVARKRSLPAKKTVKAVKQVARKATQKIAVSRKNVAIARLAKRPPAAVAKARVNVQKVKSLPPGKRPAVIANVAKKTAAKVQAAKPPTIAQQSDIEQFDAPAESSDTSSYDDPSVDAVEELQDLADVAWADDNQVTAEPDQEPEYFDDDEVEELESVEGDYDGSSCVGWSPYGAIKSAVKSVTKSTAGKIVTGIATGGISTAIEHRKKIAKVGVTLSNSPFIKAGVAGLAVAFPAVGVPAMAAMAVADKVVSASEAGGKVAEAAKSIIKSTHKQAKAGDKDASRALAVMAQVKKQRALSVVNKRAKLPGWKQRVIAALEA